MSDNHKILVSSCLMGEKVRYDGEHKLLSHPLLEKWNEEGLLIPFCPELSGGLPVPRTPSEIKGEGGGPAVLLKIAFVETTKGNDITEAFLKGAYDALEVAQKQGCRYALLTDASPSCGSGIIYDGSFSGNKIEGEGVTVALLRQHNIKVFAPADIESLAVEIENNHNSGPALDLF